VHLQWLYLLLILWLEIQILFYLLYRLTKLPRGVHFCVLSFCFICQST